MPSEVKTFLDNKSISNQFSVIDKINSFNENQVRLYVEKTEVYKQKYNKIKNEMIHLNKMKRDIMETMEREKTHMEKLKKAYR